MQRFVALCTTLTVRQKATEIALTKLGLSEEAWNAALNESISAMSILPTIESAQPLESYLETITTILKNS